MELKITKEKVKAAANKCSAAKEVLKELFPEVFEDDKYFDLSKLRQATNSWSRENFNQIFTDKSQENARIPLSSFITIACSKDGRLAGKAFWLDDDFNWELKKENGNLYLIPTKK